MARTLQDTNGGQTESSAQPKVTTLSADGSTSVEVPGTDFISNAEITRDGQDLVLTAPDGSSVVIEGYFTASPAPVIESPEGAVLTPQLVNSFVQTAGPAQYAQAESALDAGHVGIVEEVSGKATVIRTDGSTHTITNGTKIFQGDVVETDGAGAVNIVFIDETSFAVSNNARLAIDEYVFDASTESGSSNFSVLRGVFVFTSGLIGRDDPDDVEIDTPVGSIGIRGTIIAGDVDTGEITVIEGAIVMRSNSGQEMTLADQFETARFDPQSGEIEHQGTMDAGQMGSKFGSLGSVAPAFFNGMNDGPQNQGDSGDESGTQDGSPAMDGAAEEQMATEPGTEPAPEGPSAEGEQARLGPDGQPLQPASQPPMPGMQDNPFDSNAFGDSGMASDPNMPGTTDGTQNAGDPVAGAQPPAGSDGTDNNTGTDGTSADGNSGGNQTILPLALDFFRPLFDDDAGPGTIVAEIMTTVQGLSVIFDAALPPDFELVQDNTDHAFIRYVGTAGNLNAGQSFFFDVQATAQDGRVAHVGFPVGVVDVESIGALNLNSDAAPGVEVISGNINGAHLGYALDYNRPVAKVG